ITESISQSKAHTRHPPRPSGDGLSRSRSRPARVSRRFDADAFGCSRSSVGDTMRRMFIVMTLLLLLAQPARAQLVVIDPGNLIQAVLIAERTLREYDTLVAQYRTIQQMAQGLGVSLEGYRIPALPITRHDLARWEYGRPWLAGMNTGDPTGAAYWQTTRALERPNANFQALPPAARRAIEEAYATIEITDSVAQMGGHQVALIRQQSDRLQTAIDALQGDVLNGL